MGRRISVNLRPKRDKKPMVATTASRCYFTKHVFCMSTNYYVPLCLQVPRTKVVEDYQKNMGYVDRHNRFRQSLLGLSAVWKTKRWQTRVQVDIFATALVDSFLLARKFLPRWQRIDHPDDSVFMRFVRQLLPQLTKGQERQSATTITKCVQVQIGKKTVQNGVNAGKTVPIQQRCTYCLKDKRTCDGVRSRRATYTCICHPDTFQCKEGRYTCWSQHLTEVGQGQLAGEGDGDDDVTDEDMARWSSSTVAATPARRGSSTVRNAQGRAIRRSPRRQQHVDLQFQNIE